MATEAASVVTGSCDTSVSQLTKDFAAIKCERAGISGLHSLLFKKNGLNVIKGSNFKENSIFHIKDIIGQPMTKEQVFVLYLFSGHLTYFLHQLVLAVRLI